MNDNKFLEMFKSIFRLSTLIKNAKIRIEQDAFNKESLVKALDSWLNISLKYENSVTKLQKENEELKDELYEAQCFILEVIPDLEEKKKEQVVKLTNPKEGE